MGAEHHIVSSSKPDYPTTPKNGDKNGERLTAIERRLHRLEDQLRSVELVNARDEGRQAAEEDRKAQWATFWKVAFRVLQAVGIAVALIFSVLAFLASRGGS